LWSGLRRVAGVALILIVLGLLRGPADAGEQHFVYLPSVLRQEPEGLGLWGHVTEHGQGVSGVQVLLRHIVVGQGAVITHSTTSGDLGIFSFTGLPTVDGQTAYFEFRYVNTSDPTRVSIAFRPRPVAYTEGTMVEGGDLEIANLAQVTPSDGATVTLPASFTWTPNGVSTNYTLWISCAGTTRSVHPSNPDQYTLDSLPAGLSYDVECDWYVSATGPGTFYTRSYENVQVTFAESGTQR
jgi:hypothetical protein